MSESGSVDNAGALAGIRVADFSHYVAGPLATMMLADHGADVIRIDPPGGPKWDHPANAFLQRGKRSIELDLHRPEDAATAGRIIASCDVVVEGFRPGVMIGWGLDPRHYVESTDGLIWCSLPGFGCDDPRAGVRAWEGLLCSAAGLYPSSHESAADSSQQPRFTAVPMASTFGAFVAAHSIAAALIARTRYGHGDHIEIPLFDAAFEAIAYHGEWPPSTDQIVPVPPAVAAVRNAALAPAYGAMKAYQARDGRYLAHLGMPARGVHAFWDRYLPADLKDRDDPEAVREAAALLEQLIATKDAAEWERICQEELEASFATAQPTEDWLGDAHALASRSVVEVDDPVLGPTRQLGFGVMLSGSEPRVRGPRRVPGQDGAAVRAELAARPSDRNNPPRPRPVPADNGVRRALEGMRVVDFSHLLAGPIGARVLAGYGAEVIKVNKSAIARGEADPYTDDPVAFAGHRTTNAGKRMVFLDLKTDDGRRIAADLVATADVLHHNFTLEKASRIGLGPELCEQYPGLVYSTLNLHARGGWRGGYRGHEDLAQDVTGLSLRYGGGQPEMHSILINDHGTGHLSAFGVLLALFERLRTGRGQLVGAALSRTAATHQVPFMIDFAGRNFVEPGGPDAVGWHALDRLYATGAGWLYLAAPGPDGLAALRAVPGLQDLAADSDAELADQLQARLSDGSAADWTRRLAEHGVAAHPYVSIADVMVSPLAIERGLSVTKDHPGMGPGRSVGDVARFASSPGWRIGPAHHPGWHTAAVATELGWGDQVPELIDRGVLAAPVDGPSGVG